MLDRCSRRVLALATWACSACGITGPSLPANAVRFNPPAVFAKWWALTEQCSGKSRPLESLTWYTAPVVTVGREQFAGYYDRDNNRIVLEAAWVPYGDLVRHEGRGGEDKFQRVYLFQLRLESLEGVNREAGGRNLQFRARRDGLLEVIPEETVDVVDDLHCFKCFK